MKTKTKLTPPIDPVTKKPISLQEWREGDEAKLRMFEALLTSDCKPEEVEAIESRIRVIKRRWGLK